MRRGGGGGGGMGVAAAGFTPSAGERVVVLDNGAGSIKLGFGGESEPRL